MVVSVAVVGVEALKPHCACVAPPLQIPRSLDEADLLPTFEQVGPVHELVIIRERSTGAHRGT